MRLSDFTTTELQRVARILLRRYLDVQTGAAPVAALGRFLTPVAADSVQRLQTTDRPRRGIRHGDLGPIAVVRLGPHGAYAVAGLAQGGQEAAAVSVELEVHGQRLAAVRVGETESRARLRRERSEVPAVGPGQPVPEPPAHLAALLGGLPSDPRAVDRWVTAASVIDTYRERYGIDDAASAFGPIPGDLEQREERERALAYVHQLAREVEAVEPHHERTLGRDRPPGPELGL